MATCTIHIFSAQVRYHSCSQTGTEEKAEAKFFRKFEKDNDVITVH